MTKQSNSATEYPEVNAVLDVLLSGARLALRDRFIGMYLDGSLAMGDFDPDKSDVDFVVVTDGPVDPETFVALKLLHERIAAGASKWGKELEGSYVSQQSLRDEPRPAAHPYIDRGSELAMVRPESGYWVIHRHMVRECGVVMAGPPPQTLIPPVQPAELQEAVRGILREWWRPMLREGPLLQNGFYRCYAILTMSRMLYTLQRGRVVSKRVAARWAQEALDTRWTPLIQDALGWSRDVPPGLGETVAFIRHTCEHAEQLDPLTPP